MIMLPTLNSEQTVRKRTAVFRHCLLACVYASIDGTVRCKSSLNPARLQPFIRFQTGTGNFQFNIHETGSGFWRIVRREFSPCGMNNLY